VKSFRRQIANLIEALSGNLVVPPYEVYRMAEWLHLRRFFRHFKVDCVFDVGANCGQYAQMLRSKVNFLGDIVSFEPIPELVKELKEISMPDPRWHIEPLALDREAGVTTFNVMRNSEFSSLLPPRPDQPATINANTVARSIEIARSTIAAEFQRHQQRLGFRRPFLKLDTQGADLAVVEGAGETIKRFVGIQTELAIRQLYEGSPSFAETLALLSAHGFEPSAFVPNNEPDSHFPMLIEIDCILFRRDAEGA
jgi:FkbM family methyltransferase